jgi:cobalt-zinc-cadmium efflux system outer membrane protein
MDHRRIALVLSALVLTVTVPARGQSLPAEVTLDRLVLLVREQSPVAASLVARGVAADAEVDVASVYPNPELGYQFMGRTRGTNEAINGTQHTAWVEVPLLVGGQRRARRDAALAGARATRAELGLELLGLEIDARRAFAELLSAQERIAVVEQVLEELEALVSLVEQRAESGAQSAYDVARIRLERARFSSELATARADAAAAQATLASLAGQPGWTPTAVGRLTADGAMARARTQPPALQMAEARAEAARLDVRRARRERVPEVSLGIGTYVTTAPDSSSVYAGLSIPLPLFDTGRARVDRARAVEEAAEAIRAATERALTAAIEGRRATLSVRREALAEFEAETAERFADIRAMAEAAYRLGGSSVFELLDTFRTGVEVELRRIELLTDVARAEIELLAVTGRRPDAASVVRRRE